MDYANLQNALGHAPSDWEKRCYDRLKLYLKREPSDNEILNMKTDSNLQMWVLTGQ